MKKHVKLYNRVWEALHADDKFVATSQLDHAALVAYLGQAIRKRAYQSESFATWEELAEAVIEALQLSEKQKGGAK